MSILEFHGVTKDYRLGQTTVHALRGVDLSVGRGEFIDMLGAGLLCRASQRFWTDSS